MKLRIFMQFNKCFPVLSSAKSERRDRFVFKSCTLSACGSGSNDHTTKFWCRNRPGETLRENRQNNAHAQGKSNVIRNFSSVKKVMIA